jgi:tRNA A37 methylthiotransferase MiaB
LRGLSAFVLPPLIQWIFLTVCWTRTADVPQLVDHLHLPVQAGSDRILTAMKRGHTAQQYIDKVNALREIRPNISLSSDFIVGFPGETEEDFNATMDLIERVGFDVSFSFIYSARPGTPAAALETIRRSRSRNSGCSICKQLCAPRPRPLPMRWWARANGCW